MVKREAEAPPESELQGTAQAGHSDTEQIVQMQTRCFS
jgi:hypothetical protein